MSQFQILWKFLAQLKPELQALLEKIILTLTIELWLHFWNQSTIWYFRIKNILAIYWHSVWYVSGILPRQNEPENQPKIIDIAALPFPQNESKAVGFPQPVSNDFKDVGTSLQGPQDSTGSLDQGPIVRDDELKILEDHAHLPKGELCFVPITQCMQCLQNHQQCTKWSKYRVKIPRLDLQKVRDAQKLEEDGHTETPAASYVGCFGPTKRNVKRKRWTDPDREISSSSLSASTIESGTSAREDNALGPDDRSKHKGRKNKGSRALLEQARAKLSFCHL